MRFLAHLDLARTVHRALSRAEIPIAFSEGFNPHPRAGFGPPLTLGVEGLEEWVDLILERDMAATEFLERINGALSPGLGFSRAFQMPRRSPSLTSVIQWAGYRVEPLTAPAVTPKSVEEVLSSEKLEIMKKSKKGHKLVDVRRRIGTLDLDGTTLLAQLACGPEGSLGIVDLMVHFTGLEGPAIISGYRVMREKLYVAADGRPVEIASETDVSTV